MPLATSPPPPKGAEAQRPQRALAETRAWTERAVIGLNLCPFARGVQAKGQVRYAVCEAPDADGVQQALVHELQHLAATDPAHTETTLLVLTAAMRDFLDFNDFLTVADAALQALRLDGEIQVASFHPDYQFADAEADDITNATNRAPWPTLHLLRESSIDRAVAAMPDTDAIYEANLATLSALGPTGWARLQAEVAADAQARWLTEGPACGLPQAKPGPA